MKTCKSAVLRTAAAMLGEHIMNQFFGEYSYADYDHQLSAAETYEAADYRPAKNECGGGVGEYYGQPSDPYYYDTAAGHCGGYGPYHFDNSAVTCNSWSSSGHEYGGGPQPPYPACDFTPTDNGQQLLQQAPLMPLPPPPPASALPLPGMQIPPEMQAGYCDDGRRPVEMHALQPGRINNDRISVTDQPYSESNRV